jgi:hypothetical protein
VGKKGGGTEKTSTCHALERSHSKADFALSALNGSRRC